MESTVTDEVFQKIDERQVLLLLCWIDGTWYELCWMDPIDFKYVAVKYNNNDQCYSVWINQVVLKDEFQFHAADTFDCF